MKKANYYTFNINDKRYIFDYKNIHYAEITDQIEARFEHYNELLTTCKIDKLEQMLENDKDLKAVVENDIFFSDRIIELNKEYDEFFLSMPPIHGCNLGCKYCFAKQGNNINSSNRIMKVGEIREALSYIFFELVPQINKFRFDFVSGGEPFMAFQNIKKIVEVCEEFEKNGKRTNFWLCTNGTVYSEESFKYLNDHNFNIGISLDGDIDSNVYRVTKDGKSTYKTVVKTIQNIANNDMYSRNFRNIWGLVTLTSNSDDLIGILKHHKTIGFSKVQMRLVRTKEKYGLNRETLDYFKNLYKNLFDFFLNQFIGGSTEYMEMILNDNDYLGKILRRLILRRIVTHRCQAGKNKISIAADGTIFPCDAFVGISKFNMGNVLKKKVNTSKYLIDMCIYENEKCTECWCRYICGGDCYHNSYLLFEDIKKVDDSFCRLQKFLIERSIDLLCKMNEYDRKEFYYLSRRVKIATREGVN